MLCSKCGTENNGNERFCRNCGLLLGPSNVQNNQTVNNNSHAQSMNNAQSYEQNVQQNPNMYQQPVQPQQMAQPMNNTQQTFQNNQMGGVSPSYMQNAVNPDMKKWAILSIVIAVAGLIWYWFIGLSFYLAIVIAAAGFGFAKKGEMADKKLATIGRVANGMLVGMAIIMFIFQLIGIFAN